ncbi:MAG: 50S ribosomal protein L22 [Planctomycetes bacterium]|nr:50S ribosomal protein L22 [Planctomycetota bacterium]
MAETAAPAKAPEKKAEPAKPRFSARLRYARMSPRKMRYVVDLVRGKDFNSAVAILRTCSKRGAPYCKKLLESCYANAMDEARQRNIEIDGNKLHLVDARVDGGPIIKRWRPSSVRRPTMIKKRTCHVTFVLEEREPRLSKKERSKQQRQERQKTAAAAKAEAAKKAAAAKSDLPAGARSAKEGARRAEEGGPAKAGAPPPAEPKAPEAGQPPKEENK